MKALRLFHRQKTRALNRTLLRQIARCLLDDLFAWPDYEIAFHLIESAEMAQLHESFLQISGSTDVITFDYAEKMDERRGEIFISVADAVTQSAQFKCSWQEEVARYIVHGLLHLDGFDDTRPELRRTMKRRESALLKDLSRHFVLRKLGARTHA